MANGNDEYLIWPMHGKQITLGVEEQGKPVKDRTIRRRSTTTTPSGTKWANPSVTGADSIGWSNFLIHELFYYPKWNYVYDDTVKFTFGVTDVTGVWLECDLSADSFERCFYQQDTNDDLNFDSDGALYKRGLARIKSMPMHQWGKRCLQLTLQASTSFTVSSFVDLVEEESQIPIFRQRFYPITPEQM